MRMRYRIELTPDDNGTFLVTAPDLPEVTTFGETADEALVRAVDAIETALQGRIADREPIPAPTAVGDGLSVALPALAALKVELYRTMLQRDLRKADLARLLGWQPPQVDRLLDLGHGSRLDQLEAAFAALGQEVVFSLNPASNQSEAA
jgi:antitoxin HicB